MKVNDVMQKYPLVGTPDESLRQAIQHLAWIGGRHLPVVEGERLVGIVSEHDLAGALAQAPDWATTLTLRDVMQQPVQTCGPQDSLTEVTGRMAVAKIGCLPVTEQGRLVGLLTITDVLLAQVRESIGGGGEPAARDIMTEHPVTVRPDDHLLDAAARMQRMRVRHLPVVDGGGRLVGMLSDRDIRNVVGDPMVGIGDDAPVSLETLRVEDAMSRDPVTVAADASISELTRILSDLTVSAVPVLDARQRPVGIVSYVDVLRAYASRRVLT